MTTLITNIRRLINTREESHILRGRELSVLPSIENAFLLVEDGIIADFGEMTLLKSKISKSPKQIINAKNQCVLPTWCDSHTHVVFAGSREAEFADRIKGLSYSEIAAKGGGILSTAKKVNESTEDELFSLAWKRLEQITKMGTGAVEIKSGYGLNTQCELKMLRVIRKLKERSKISIKATFLGAHAFPVEFAHNHKGYIDAIINEMLPAIARDKLADYIDVFCQL